MRHRLATTGLALTVIAALSSNAVALPSTGEARPALVVHDADDRPFDLRSVNGRPTLVIYESKETNTQNQALKDELSRLAHGDAYRNKVALVPIADVASYSFWPAKGFVRDAIRSESKKAGTTIYCDWDGSAGRALGVRPGRSTVVLVGRSGKVLLSADGPLDAERRKALVDALRNEVGG